MWKVIDTGPACPETNMRLDADLLRDLVSNEESILHLYSWKGISSTYGHFIKPETLLDLRAAERLGLSLAKRPTGGGVIFHMTDLAFSVLIPAVSPDFSQNTLSNYAFVNDRVSQALRDYMGKDRGVNLLPTEPVPLDSSCKSFCMAKPTKYDIIVDGRKVGGAAQRQTRWGFLHQGSISIAMPDKNFLEQVLLPNSRVLEGMQKHSYTLLGDSWSEDALEQTRNELKELLVQVFTKA
ncbi:Uncharacterized protein SCG7109_AT_00030 [Chlamydiales bacterium SCGC AG-110-M15]|nr:Uncharacterized protein SCG7109_AT_00030 [Chlamydiales bacterium SCGC AG-110-M15]